MYSTLYRYNKNLPTLTYLTYNKQSGIGLFDFETYLRIKERNILTEILKIKPYLFVFSFDESIEKQKSNLIYTLEIFNCKKMNLQI